jgi:hypothetical protein
MKKYLEPKINTLKENAKDLQNKLDKINKNIFCLEYLQNKYPNIRSNYFGDFCTTSTKKLYEDLEIMLTYNTLSCVFFFTENYTVNNNNYEIKIYDNPRTHDLATISSNYDDHHHKRSTEVNFIPEGFKFSRNFKPDTLSLVQTKLAEFISKTNSLVLNTEHLDSRIKKMLSFI